MPRFAFVNNELTYFDKLTKGEAIRITEGKSIECKKKMMKAVEHSIYSEKLGKLEDEASEINEYSCKCGNPEMVGRIYEGQICPKCETPVEETFGKNIDEFGWIDIGKYRVLQPAAYMKVRSLIGKNIEKIITFDDTLDLQGKLSPIYDKKNPYNGIGMINFYNKFDEIIYYFGRKKGKLVDAEFLIKNKNRLFTSKIAVLSQYLRPSFMNSSEKTLRFDPINHPYNEIVNASELIKEAIITNNIISINKYLTNIQLTLAELYVQIVNKLNGKKKLLRGQIQGTRCSFSSRMVIAANTGVNFGLDHIVISYKAFFQLYKLEIINCLKRGYVTDKYVNHTIYEILKLSKNMYSSKVDPDILEVMRFLIKNHQDGLWCLLNRPPTLDLGSIQCVQIVDVIPNAVENIMFIPLTSLNPLNGDFDGDTLSLYSIKEKCQAEEFINGFNPKVLCLDRTSSTKLYNPQFGLLKDLNVYLFDFLDKNKKINVG